MSESKFVLRVTPEALDLITTELARVGSPAASDLYLLKPTEHALQESARESSIRCPVLQDRIDDGREVVTCPRCKMTYHVECVKVGLQSGLEKCLRPDCGFALAGMLTGNTE
jgi:hypothetical protein